MLTTLTLSGAQHPSMSSRKDGTVGVENYPPAVIELKVSDGWKGKTMTEHLDNRKREIRDIWPGVFFGAISFWNCFGDGIKTENSEYIGLFNFKTDNNHEATGQTIEQLVAACRDAACRDAACRDAACRDAACRDAACHVSTTTTTTTTTITDAACHVSTTE